MVLLKDWSLIARHDRVPTITLYRNHNHPIEITITIEMKSTVIRPNPRRALINLGQ